ncbi:MAG: DUF4398 domain-containing protein [Polyangiaceae bacterium]
MQREGNLGLRMMNEYGARRRRLAPSEQVRSEIEETSNVEFDVIEGDGSCVRITRTACNPRLPQEASSLGARVLCALTLLVATGSAGCGNTLYAIQANAASNKVEEARELDAEKYAPYEYYYAKEHLEKAEAEAAEADYSDASNLAEVAEEYADKAIRLTREARRGAGR